MHDIGWPSLCGNSTMDTGEDCDNGSANSDTLPDACRTDCSRAHCGDGVKDTGEACDLGLQNGASGSACSSTCMTLRSPRRRNGDGVDGRHERWRRRWLSGSGRRRQQWRRDGWQRRRQR